MSKPIIWTVNIDMDFGGQHWSIALTSSETSILTLLRTMYDTFEEKLKEVAKVPSPQRPSGLIDEALSLLRCLVFNKLEVIEGKYIKLTRN